MNISHNHSRAYFWASSIAKSKISNAHIAGSAAVSGLWLIGTLLTGKAYFIAPSIVCAFYAWLQFERKGFIEILSSDGEQKPQLDLQPKR